MPTPRGIVRHDLRPIGRQPLKQTLCHCVFLAALVLALLRWATR
jgi:hypothetical protein